MGKKSYHTITGIKSIAFAPLEKEFCEHHPDEFIGVKLRFKLGTPECDLFCECYVNTDGECGYVAAAFDNNSDGFDIDLPLQFMPILIDIINDCDDIMQDFNNFGISKIVQMDDEFYPPGVNVNNVVNMDGETIH